MSTRRYADHAPHVGKIPDRTIGLLLRPDRQKNHLRHVLTAFLNGHPAFPSPQTRQSLLLSSGFIRHCFLLPAQGRLA